MFLRLTPGRDEAAALALDDLASALDAGLTPAQLGASADIGESVLGELAAARRIALDPAQQSLLAAAWQAGRGPVALRRMAEQRRQRAVLARTLLQSLRYPALLIVLSAAIAMICGNLIGNRLLVYGPLIAVLGLAAAAIVAIRAAGSGGERWLRVPLAGDLMRDLAEIPYLEVLHGLYASGVPLLRANKTAISSCPIAAVRERLQAADTVLQAGRPLHEALQVGDPVHAETRQLIANGERAGNLEQALGNALNRRRDVAQRRAAQLARIAAIAAQVLGYAVAITTIFSFYSSYFGLLRGHH